MQTAVIIFLAITTAVLVIAFMLITTKHIEFCQKLEADESESVSRIETLIQDKEKLLLENITLQEKNDELYSDNVKLTEAVKELREINKALMQEPVVTDNDVGSKERLPEGVATNRYDCEGYKFPSNTQQWLLQGQCETDWETGIRIFTRGTTRYRCVAMGTAYGIDIGDTWEVTLNNGYSFPIILADYQHDISVIDPNDFGERYVYDNNGNIIDVLRNYDGQECVHVLEFIADLDEIPQAAKEAGGMHGLTIFGGKFGDGGNIAKLKYLGRVWKP